MKPINDYKRTFVLYPVIGGYDFTDACNYCSRIQDENKILHFSEKYGFLSIESAEKAARAFIRPIDTLIIKEN